MPFSRLIFLATFCATVSFSLHRTFGDDWDSLSPLPRLGTATHVDRFVGRHPHIKKLAAIESRVEDIVPKLLPSVVALGSGSGVIVSEDGYILTASHVTQKAGRIIKVKLADGRVASAMTLGTNSRTDTAAAKLLDKGPWPFAKLGLSPKVNRGDWCLAIGYPWSYERGQPGAIRLGRVLAISSNRYVTDCPIMGGDSGGPLFNISGELIGISSRIKRNVHHNIHIPIDRFRNDWSSLADSREVFDFWNPGDSRDLDSNVYRKDGVRHSFNVADSAGRIKLSNSDPASKYGRDSTINRNAYGRVGQKLIEHTITFPQGKNRVASTLVSPDGLVITKYSELSPEIAISKDAARTQPELIAKDLRADIALLKLPARYLKGKKPILFPRQSTHQIVPGQIVVSTGNLGRPVVGIVSVDSRSFCSIS